MITLLLACTGDLPDDSDQKDTDTGTVPVATCGTIVGTETDGDYAECYAVGSPGFYNLGGATIGDCEGCTFSVFLYGDPAAGASCELGEADVSVNDEAFAEFADGGTAAYAGLGADGPLGSCTITTTSWAADDDNSHAWAGSITADLVLLDTFGEEVGVRTVEITADIADPE